MKEAAINPMSKKNLDKEIGFELEPSIKLCDDLSIKNNKLSRLLEIKDKLTGLDGAEALISQIDEIILSCEGELKTIANDLLSHVQKISILLS